MSFLGFFLFVCFLLGCVPFSEKKNPRKKERETKKKKRKEKIKDCHLSSRNLLPIFHFDIMWMSPPLWVLPWGFRVLSYSGLFDLHANFTYQINLRSLLRYTELVLFLFFSFFQIVFLFVCFFFLLFLKKNISFQSLSCWDAMIFGVRPRAREFIFQRTEVCVVF